MDRQWCHRERPIGKIFTASVRVFHLERPLEFPFSSLMVHSVGADSKIRNVVLYSFTYKISNISLFSIMTFLRLIRTYCFLIPGGVQDKLDKLVQRFPYDPTELMLQHTKWSSAHWNLFRHTYCDPNQTDSEWIRHCSAWQQKSSSCQSKRWGWNWPESNAGLHILVGD